MTRNTNTINDAIGGVSFTLLSTGTSTITVNDDYEAMIEDVTEFVDAYNTAVQTIYDELSGEGDLGNDVSIRMVENYLRTTIFGRPTGVTGNYESLAGIGITTGDTFEQDVLSLLEVDEGQLREALETDRDAVESLFTNPTQDGIADLFGANGTISDQIDSLNDRIDAIEDRLVLKEERLRRQFTQMEMMLSELQSINSFLLSQFAALETL